MFPTLLAARSHFLADLNVSALAYRPLTLFQDAADTLGFLITEFSPSTYRIIP